MSYNDYEAVVGLEIHVQLSTKSKLFCGSAASFGGHDNDHICPVCVGMPGSLPVLNEKVLDYAIKTGLALGCSIRRESVFARKQYFYPDLPKGYQISQYDQPLCEHGHVEFFIGGQKRRISVTRAHLEEDAGKSTHHGDYTLINLNRAGVPLLEIVSAPELRSAAEAAEYARAMRNIVRYLDVCDGNMEEGSLRCDCNVSVRRKGAEKLGTKVELKNINSFRFIEKAIDYEVQRQIDCLEMNEPIYQETRLYDPDKNRTFAMRSKEEAHDYRYFPDPDLLPIKVNDEIVERARKSIPELPLARAERFINHLGLPEYDAHFLTQERQVADYFEKVTELSRNPKAASNWVMTELMRDLNNSGLEISKSPITPESLAELIRLIDQGIISGKIAKAVFPEMWAGESSPERVVKEKGLVQITDVNAIESLVEAIIAANPIELAQYQAGKEKVFGFFVGQVMKASKGQASPELVNELLKRKLKK
jgi:aspartyl-tRNA(Asn)/glutamyl-tRNA(Gln) amidotransferase subunit B